jgi:hypothetical protein
VASIQESHLKKGQKFHLVGHCGCGWLWESGLADRNHLILVAQRCTRTSSDHPVSFA